MPKNLQKNGIGSSELYHLIIYFCIILGGVLGMISGNLYGNYEAVFGGILAGAFIGITSPVSFPVLVIGIPLGMIMKYFGFGQY